MKFKATDIRDKRTFKRIGHTYTMIAADEENHIYLFKMTKPGISYDMYEIVKGVKAKQPDGTTVYKYPSDEQFGVYGFYICGGPEKCGKDIERRYIDLGGSPDFNALLET